MQLPMQKHRKHEDQSGMPTQKKVSPTINGVNYMKFQIDQKMEEYKHE